MKKVLYAASEAVPFIKTGGLADVVGTLPGYFPKDEYDVRVILPKYACMKEELSQNLKKILTCRVDLNWRQQFTEVYEAQADGITYYLIGNDFYFAGPKPYDHIYLDAEKFAYFSKAVLTILPLIEFQPDIIHTHDWQTGLVPAFLKVQFAQDPFYRYIRTIHTIHNMKYQGRWYIDAVKDITGLPDHCFTNDTMECYGKANLLKAGLVYADRITTVSASYAIEIQTPDGGEGLDGLMRARCADLSGICNGIDYEAYDPRTDPQISRNLKRSVPVYKAANKADLQKEMGLDEDPDAFLIGMVSRLADQKGFDLVLQAGEEILKVPGVQMVILGSGEERYENALRGLASKDPSRICAWIGYSDQTAHRIYAGADAFLMPSQFEPCGLSQMIAMRYGTVPLVRMTGGLLDTVEPYNAQKGTGDGFAFGEYNAWDMLRMIGEAAGIYRNEPDAWARIRENGMRKDFSWKKSADGYRFLYDRFAQDAGAQKKYDLAAAREEADRTVAQKEAELAEAKKAAEEAAAREAAGTACIQPDAAQTAAKQTAAQKPAEKQAAAQKSAAKKEAAKKTAEKQASAQKPAAKQKTKQPKQ